MIGLKAEAKLHRAVQYIFNEHPFCAGIVARWKFSENPQLTPTMATDGIRLVWNREFVDKCSIAETCFVLLHEAGHCFLGHHLRMLHPVVRDSKLWNVGSDLSLNSYIKIYRPQGCEITLLMPGERDFADTQKWPHGLTAEEYYERIVAEIERKNEEQKSQMATQSQSDKDSPEDDGDESSDRPTGDSEESEGPESKRDTGAGQGDSETDRQDADDGDETGGDVDGNQSDGDDSLAEDGQAASDSDSERSASGEDGDSGDDGDEPGRAAKPGQDAHGLPVPVRSRDGQHREAGGDVPAWLPTGIPGEVLPHPDSDDPELAGKLNEEWQLTVAQGVNAAKACGNLPGWLKEIAETLYGGKSQDWKRILRQWVSKVSRDRLSYQRPSRRHGHRTDVIMPGRHGKTAKRVRVILDTSGSMSNEEMQSVLDEIQGALLAYPKCEVVLMMCDTRIADEKSFTRWDFPLKVPPEWKGRGGTDLDPAFEAVKLDKQCEAVICLSDMEWSAADAPNPGLPVIWLSTRTAPADLSDYARPKFGICVGPVCK